MRELIILSSYRGPSPPQFIFPAPLSALISISISISLELFFFFHFLFFCTDAIFFFFINSLHIKAPLQSHPHGTSDRHDHGRRNATAQFHGSIRQPFHRKMHQCDHKRPPCQGIHVSVVDAVGGIGPHDGGETRPCAKGAGRQGRHLTEGAARTRPAVETPSQVEAWASVCLNGVEDRQDGNLCVFSKKEGVVCIN